MLGNAVIDDGVWNTETSKDFARWLVTGMDIVQKPLERRGAHAKDMSINTARQSDIRCTATVGNYL